VSEEPGLGNYRAMWTGKFSGRLNATHFIIMEKANDGAAA